MIARSKPQPILFTVEMKQGEVKKLIEELSKVLPLDKRQDKHPKLRALYEELKAEVEDVVEPDEEEEEEDSDEEIDVCGLSNGNKYCNLAENHKGRHQYTEEE